MIRELLAEASTLTNETLVPFAMLVAAIIGALGIYGWLSKQFTTLSKRLDSIETHISGAKTTARLEMRLWIAQFKAANPDLTVPDFPEPTPDPKSE